MDRSRTAFFFIVRSYHFVKISSWLDNNPTTTLTTFTPLCLCEYTAEENPPVH